MIYMYILNHNIYIPTWRDKKDAMIISKIDRFLSSFNDGEKDKMDELDKDIMLVLYNNRKISEKTKKQVEKVTK